MRLGFLACRPFCLRGWGRIFSPPLWAYLSTALGMLGLYHMGQWQLERAAFKEALFERYAARSQLAPQSLQAVAARLNVEADVADYPVQSPGHYEAALTLFWDNQMQGAVAGYHVLTVFRPVGDGPAVLVDRGWVKADRDRRQLPQVAAPQSKDLRGITATPSGGLQVGAEDYQSRPLRLLHLNTAEISQALGVSLYPFLVRLEEQAADGYIRSWTPKARIRMGPEKHRAYAFQWFSLMAALGLIFLVVNWRRIRPTI